MVSWVRGVEELVGYAVRGFNLIRGVGGLDECVCVCVCVCVGGGGREGVGRWALSSAVEDFQANILRKVN